MMMVNERPGIVRAPPPRGANSGRQFRILSSEESACPEPRVETANFGKSGSSKGEIRPVNYPLWNKTIRGEKPPLRRLLDGDPAVCRIMQQNPASDKAQSLIFSKAREYRIQIILCRV